MQERRVEIEFVHELVLDFFKVVLRDLVEEQSQFADLIREAIVRLFLRTMEHCNVKLDLSLLVRKDEQGHVVWALLVFVTHRHHEVNRVCLFSFLFQLFLLLLFLLFLDVDGL